MRLNLPKPTVAWVKESDGAWSLQSKGENAIEVARVPHEREEWTWITFWPSTCPDGSPEIDSGWRPSARDGKLQAKESLIKSGVLK